MHRYQQTQHALGSDALITIVVDSATAPEELFTRLWHEIAVFEGRFSRFLQHSELSNFNAQAGATVEVTPAFRDLLEVARGMATQTDGLYNPLILPALQRAGYKGSWPEINTTHEALNYETRSVASPTEIRLTTRTAAIPPDTALDFGGIGKGYLLEQLAGRLQDEGITNYWISLGGDIFCNGIDETGEPWRVAIQDARSSDKAVTSASNDGKQLAVATSGITKRKGEGWHHIIDPRTFQPADTDVLTATVCTSAAITADVFAKCLVILGSEQARPFMKKHRLANALLQTEKGNLKVGAIWSN